MELLMKQVYMPIAIIFSATTARAMDINAYPDCHDEIASFQSNDADSRNGDDKVSHIDYAHEIIRCIEDDIKSENMADALDNANHLVHLINMLHIPKKDFLGTAQDIFTKIENKASKEKLPQSFKDSLKKGKEKLNKLL